MACYFRHLGMVFIKANIEVTKENKKDIVKIIRQLTGETECPAVWRQIKKLLAENETGFINDLKTEYLKLTNKP